MLISVASSIAKDPPLQAFFLAFSLPSSENVSANATITSPWCLFRYPQVKSICFQHLVRESLIDNHENVQYILEHLPAFRSRFAALFDLHPTQQGYKLKVQVVRKPLRSKRPDFVSKEPPSQQGKEKPLKSFLRTSLPSIV
jgi:hypothetical protein